MAPNIGYLIFDPVPDQSYGDYRTEGRTITFFFDDEFHDDVLPGMTKIPTPESLRNAPRKSDATEDGSESENFANVEGEGAPPAEPEAPVADAEEEPAEPRPWFETYALQLALGVIGLGFALALLVRPRPGGESCRFVSPRARPATILKRPDPTERSFLAER